MIKSSFLLENTRAAIFAQYSWCRGYLERIGEIVAGGGLTTFYVHVLKLAR